MIEDGEPQTWQDLEIAVERILNEAGYRATRGRKLNLARGEAQIDVFAEDLGSAPPTVTIFECKNWGKPVDQSVVHAFRNVVSDSGANAGILVAKSGFQSGAVSAAQFSNVRLLTWAEFQVLYEERWFKHYLTQAAAEALDPLIEYTEPVNSRIFRKADALPPAKRSEFKRLREVYAASTFWLFMELCPNEFLSRYGAIPDLPIRSGFPDGLDLDIPDAILDANSLRGILVATIDYAEAALAHFDDAFGGRA